MRHAAFRYPAALSALGLLAMPCLCPAANSGPSVKAAIEKVMPSVVEIHVLDEEQRQAGSGSGFVVDPSGLVATAYHVIRDAQSARVILADGKHCRILGLRHFDPDRDFALLQVECTRLPAVELGDSAPLEVGDTVLAIGAPLGLALSVSQGIVSQVRTHKGLRLIQHTAALSNGSSGGPLVNSQGEVVGINLMLAEGGHGLFFALPISYVRDALLNLPPESVALADLKQSREVVEGQPKEVELAQAIAENFYRYTDPDDLFALLLPKLWRLERSVSQNGKGIVAVTLAAGEPGTQASHLSGHLSRGIRIHVLEARGGRKLPDSSVRRWVDGIVTTNKKAYKLFSPIEEPKWIEFAGAPALRTKFLAVGRGASEVAVVWMIVALSSRHPAIIEIASPAQDGEALLVISAVCLSTFEWLPPAP